MMRIAVLGLGLGLCAQAALAQTPKPILDCAAILNDGERLACYDSAVKSLSSEARATAERREAQAARLAAAAAATAAAHKSDSFGREGMKVFGKTEESRLDQIDAKLTELLKDSSGRLVFVLENGQIWRQAAAYPLPAAKPGAGIRVKRGAMGAYYLNVEGSNRAVQVLRMR